MACDTAPEQKLEKVQKEIEKACQKYEKAELDQDRKLEDFSNNRQ